MKILFKGLYIFIARNRLKNLFILRPSILNVVHMLGTTTSRGDVYDALMRNKQELSNIEKQFKQLVNNTDLFLEAIKKSYENADSNIADIIIHHDIIPVHPVAPIIPITPITPITPVIPITPISPINLLTVITYQPATVPTYRLISPLLSGLSIKN